MLALVTGATGELGRVLVGQLTDAGHEVRKTSRHPQAGDRWVVADLRTGSGVGDAVAGVDTIVHCASGARGDVDAARHLIDAAKAAGVRHLVYISIVGVDRVPLGYYKAKLAVERVIESAGLPYTILRATQFHTLLVRGFGTLAKLPVMPVPAMPCQPIAVAEVAAELARLAGGEPAGRVADLGGPRVQPMADLVRDYLSAVGKRRPMVPLRLPGTTFGAYRRGDHLARDRAVGKITFAEYLRDPDRN